MTKEETITVFAVQWDGKNVEEMNGFVGSMALAPVEAGKPFFLLTPNSQLATMDYVQVGNFVVRDIDGNLLSFHEAQFAEQFSKTDDNPFWDEETVRPWPKEAT